MDSIEVYVWLIVFIVLTAIEMATFQLVTIWFAVGAVAAFITSLFSTSLEIQLIVFLAVSMLLLRILKTTCKMNIICATIRELPTGSSLLLMKILKRQMLVWGDLCN